MYTIFIFFSKGGIKAVIWTDVIQYWIMLASVLAILIQVLGNFGFFLLRHLSFLILDYLLSVHRLHLALLFFQIFILFSMPTGPISGTKFIFSVHVFQVPKSSSKRGDNLKNIFLVTKVLLIILFMYGRLNVFF